MIYSHKIKTAFCVILMQFLSLFTHAQSAESYISDTTEQDGGVINQVEKYNNSIIISGSSFDRYPNQPTVMRVDTNGNKMWSTSLFDSIVYNNLSVQKFFISNNYVYAQASLYISPTMYRQVWKIDINTGQIIWRKSIAVNYNAITPATNITDYDSTRFLLDYPQNNTQRTIAVISKITGDTISTCKVPFSGYFFSLSVDSAKNIYYVQSDSLFKLSASSLNTPVWKTKFTAPSLFFVTKVYVDSNDSLWVTGYYESFSTKYHKLLSMNKSSGAQHWSSSIYTGSMAMQDMKDIGGYFYFAWRHTLVGGGTYPYDASKVNKNTGAVIWSSTYVFNGIGTPGSHSGNGGGPMALDVDAAGNVYMTGYYKDANFGPENWGIVKLNASGTVVYEKTITLDSAKINNTSVGLGICVINNIPYFIGELETYSGLDYYELYTHAFVKLAAGSGTPLIVSLIGGSFQFPSKTVKLISYGTSDLVALKQIGRRMWVERYDAQKNLVWKKMLLQKYFLEAGQICTDVNGDILVSGVSSGSSNTSPYYNTTPDSMYVYRISATGNLTQKFQFYVGVANSRPLELYSDQGGVLFVYTKNNILYLRKISSSVLSSELATAIVYSSSLSDKRYCYNYSQTEALLIGRNTSLQTVVQKLTKSTMTLTTIDYLPSKIGTTNFLLEKNATEVVVCGKNNSSNSESIALYSAVTLDTIWCKQLSVYANSQVLKCVTDPQKNFIYSVANSNSNIVVRKHSMASGNLVWQYSYAGTSGLNDLPADISFNPVFNHVVVAGYEPTSSTDKNILVITLDTLGNAKDTISKPGDSAGDNIAYCTANMSDGTQMAGGSIQKISTGKTAFIFELTSPPVITSQSGGDSVCHGNSSTLFVNTNVNNAVYTWYKNGIVTTASDSSSLVITSMTAVDSGTYYCVVSNPIGNDTSALMQLLYLPEPFIQITAADSIVCAGTTVNLTASGGAVYTWSNGSQSVNDTLTVINNVTVVLNGSDTFGCSGTDSLLLIADTTCAAVWPGDANNDGTADNNDIIEIGLHFGQTGTQRASTDNNWIAHQTNNWNTDTVSTGYDICYADCNGDSIIDLNDTLAINLNYGLTHTFKTGTFNFQQTQGDLYFTSQTQVYGPGDSVEIDIYLGINTTPLQDFYGAVFTLNYSGNVFAPGTVNLSIDDSCWIGNINLETIRIGITDESVFSAYGAISRITHTNTQGYGHVGILRFTVPSNFTGVDTFSVGSPVVYMVDSSGTKNVLTAGTLSVVISSVTDINDPDSPSSSVKIFPVPVKDILQLENLEAESIVELYDSRGRLIRKDFIQDSKHTINTSTLDNGFYFITVTGKTTTQTQRIMIAK